MMFSSTGICDFLLFEDPKTPDPTLTALEGELRWRGSRCRRAFLPPAISRVGQTEHLSTEPLQDRPALTRNPDARCVRIKLCREYHTNQLHRRNVRCRLVSLERSLHTPSQQQVPQHNGIVMHLVMGREHERDRTLLCPGA